MLEYFGFYIPLANAPELGEPVEPPSEPFVARAARLGDRHGHTPRAVPPGRAWERSPER
jgi:hypothetical protein